MSLLSGATERTGGPFVVPLASEHVARYYDLVALHRAAVCEPPAGAAASECLRPYIDGRSAAIGRLGCRLCQSVTRW